MKKYLALLLALVMAIGLFAGCTPAENNGTEGDDEQPTITAGAATETGVIDTERTWWGEEDGKTPIVLRFWAAIAPEYGYQAVCDNFNAAYGDRGLTIEYVQYKNDTNGNLAVETTLTTGEGIDVLISYGNLSKLVPRSQDGLLLNLADYLSDFDINEELGEHATDGIINEDGSYYGLPTTFSVGSSYMLINKDMFDAAGIAIPYDGWTYSEFLDACEKLTNEDHVGVCWYCQSIGTAYGHVRSAMGDNWLYTDETKDESAFKNPAWATGLEMIQTSIENGWACPYGECKSDKHDINTFINQECAIFALCSQIRQCMDTTNYPHDFVTAMVPAPVPDGEEYEQYKTMEHRFSIGEYVAAAAKTQYPEQAAEFVRWFVQGGMNPTILAGRYPLWLGNDASDILASVKDMVGDTVDIKSMEALFSADRSTLPLGDSSTALDTKVKSELKKAWEGYLIQDSERLYQTAEEAMNEAYKNAQALLDAATADEKK